MEKEKLDKLAETYLEIQHYLYDWSEVNDKPPIRYQPEIEKYINKNKNEKKSWSFEIIMLVLVIAFLFIWLKQK